MFIVGPTLSTNVGKSALTPVAFLMAKIHPNRAKAGSENGAAQGRSSELFATAETIGHLTAPSSKRLLI
jgi:hypothetical protein